MLLLRETLMRIAGWIVLFSGLVVGGLADAAMPIVVDGTLRGATGVEVAGSVYDVEFVEGSCSSLFAGCDEDSDFLFTDRATAGLAAGALLDQVFIDGDAGLFDSNPELTHGCPSGSHPLGCRAYVPYTALLDCGGGSPCFHTAISDNRSAGSPTADHVTAEFGPLPSTYGSGTVYEVWSVWTLASGPSVPSLGAFGVLLLSNVLICIGLAGVAARSH